MIIFVHRHHGRNILRSVATNGDFAQMWDKFAPRKERESLREVISKINLKERYILSGWLEEVWQMSWYEYRNTIPLGTDVSSMSSLNLHLGNPPKMFVKSLKNPIGFSMLIHQHHIDFFVDELRWKQRLFNQFWPSGMNLIYCNVCLFSFSTGISK